MSDEVGTMQDLAAYAMPLELWRPENPITTTKLQALLAANAALVAVAVLNGTTAEKMRCRSYAVFYTAGYGPYPSHARSSVSRHGRSKYMR